MTNSNQISFVGLSASQNPVWLGNEDKIAFEPEGIKDKLLNLHQPCYFVRKNGVIGVTNQGSLGDGNNKLTDVETLTAIAPLLPQQLGDRNFLDWHGVKYAYMTGAMANGIASEELVIALGKAHILSSFGAAGLTPKRIEKAINNIQNALPEQLYCFNLIHSPSESAMEKATVDLYLQYGVRTIEASAFIDLTANLVYYRVKGLKLNSQNRIEINHKVIAKVSRREVASKFMQPAPTKILKQLLEQGLITEQQAQLASQVPMADDITVEADSGGHTDNRPLVCLLPALIALRNKIQAKYNYVTPIRIGAGGGIGTPQSALGALMMGAAYIVTGSINQSSVEARTSEHVKQLLAQAEMTDIMMAPSADMFELGVKVQVLKRGTMFAMRSQKLYEYYHKYDAIEQIPQGEREKLEKQIFKKSLEQVWQETIVYFQQRDPQQITRAENNPKRKMALIFRWYLGLSSSWANIGELGREMDYQIWCGASMGAFNNWVANSYLAKPNNRRVVDIAYHLMLGTAYLYRLQNLRLQGINMPSEYYFYNPQPF